MVLEVLSFVSVVLICLKIYLKKTTGIYHGNERLDGKTVAITGASSGIGIETAKDLARRGARVLMLCRNLEKAEKVRQNIIKETGNENVLVKCLDLTSLKSIRQCAKQILDEEERLDILVNNAGAGYVPVHATTEDGLNLLMQTNYFGHFLLTNLLLGLIMKSTPSRIVNLTSYMYMFANLDLNDLNQNNVWTRGRHYSNTKLANIYLSVSLAEKLKGTGVTVNSAHPGVIPTEITRNYNKIWESVNTFVLKLFFKSVWEGAQTTIFLCVSPTVAKVTGKYFRDCQESATTEVANDVTIAHHLWELSEQAVKLTEEEKHYPINSQIL